jgi:membrane protein DedA with SNARE-associated domain/rhodanese-related sulfurtransferase
MKHMVEFLARHGYWLLFVAVVCRQACLPVPANLLLVAAGALAGLGKLNLAAIMIVSVAAFLLADMAWYAAGRSWGGRTLEFVCGATRDPGACVGKISANFSRHGVRLLLVSKFLFGVDAVAAPMSGISRISIPRFLIFDAVGAILWSSVYVALGYIFSDQLDCVAEYTAKLARLLAVVGIAVLCGVIIRRLVRWYRFVREFSLSRITPEELKEKLSTGARILVLDLQGGLSQEQELAAIPGAVRINPHLLRQYLKQYRNVDLGTDREVVLYCAALGEATSARVALALKQRGFAYVRPLAGGLEAWRNHGFAVTTDVRMLPAEEHAVYLLREVLQYSRTSAARLLKTSAADIDRLFEHAMRRIGRPAWPPK